MTATLVEYLTAAAHRHPDAPAVRAQGGELSYAQLRRRADRLARVLADAGVRPGERVALWLNKSIESIVAIHGVLRCGAVYVPVDPAVAVARALTVMGDCAVSALVTTADRRDLLGERLRTVAPRAVVVTGDAAPTEHTGAAQFGWARDIDGAPDVTDAAPVPADTGLGPDDPAYILYTSGSTGAPKGVTLSHRNATSFVDWTVTEFAITAEDRLAGHAPLHFDLSILDVFASAAAGACLVLVPERHRAVGLALNRLVHDERITVWYSVPGALTAMLDAANHSLLTGAALREVLFAGDVFPVKHLRALRDIVPAARLWNLYGPTETNVCTYHRVGEPDLDPARTTPPPIGRACPYAVAFLLDQDGSAVEWVAGAEGELCVAGESVMLGYWGDRDGTDRRFVTLPGAGGAPVRAYRTGDIVQLDQRGDLVFVGRRDHMVKTRGYRVELGEIEAALLAVPEIGGAACVAVPDPHIGSSIEAYLVPAPGAEIDPDATRRHVLATLPRYMLPAHVEVIDAFPVTSTGKVDRRDLLERSTARAAQHPQRVGGAAR